MMIIFISMLWFLLFNSILSFLKIVMYPSIMLGLIVCCFSAIDDNSIFLNFLKSLEVFVGTVDCGWHRAWWFLIRGSICDVDSCIIMLVLASEYSKLVYRTGMNISLESVIIIMNNVSFDQIFLLNAVFWKIYLFACYLSFLNYWILFFYLFRLRFDRGVINIFNGVITLNMFRCFNFFWTADNCPFNNNRMF